MRGPAHPFRENVYDIAATDFCANIERESSKKDLSVAGLKHSVGFAQRIQS